ncbi:MAG: DUF3800 domain-containing protein [Candidatus Sulfotelmatobacter sp.]
MAKWLVYFDDSGTHLGSEIAVAACYIAPAQQWRRFDSAWNKVRQAESFDVFHMAEFVARSSDFKGWDDQKRDRVIRRLIGIINQYTTQGFAIALPKSDYDAVIPEDFKKKLGTHHYTWCVKMCFGEIEKWRQGCSLSDPMEYVFESGTKGATGELLDTFFKYSKTQPDALPRYGLVRSGYHFQKKSETVRLQAADILAWETCYQMRNVTFASQPKKPRKSYVELHRRNHAKVFFIRRHQIEKWVKQSRELEAAGEPAFSI